MSENNSGLKASVQKLGSQLSSMVMPNIGAFIAWGLFAALFIPTGYLPNESLNVITGTMQTYLLPLLIAYSGGNLVYGQRGAVVGAIATMGVIAGSEVPMFIGAMLMGPFAGWVIKKFDDIFQDKIPSGFEMLINNFSSGIIGFILAIIGFFAVGPMVSTLTNWMAIGVEQIISWGVLPLTNILIEPAKILFLNNAINHGILTPLGNLQVSEVGKSILFLLEANPGPGLGVLLAFAFFGRGSAKGSSWGAMLIHFVGGIHEIYFPYVMTNPLLLLAVIAGGITGTFVLNLFSVGLTGPASPGSILAILGVTARGDHLGVLAGVLAAAAVSFAIAALILRFSGQDEKSLEEQQAASQRAKAESKGQASELDVEELSDDVPTAEEIDRIIFACDAGMGSSAMGASLLRKKAKQIGLDKGITNSAINNLVDDQKTLVITQEELTPRARRQAPSSTHISVENFLDSDRYDEILAEMSQKSDSLPDISEEEITVGATTEQVVKPTDAVESSDSNNLVLDNIESIRFVYDDKVGATTMAASNLRNQFQKEGLDISIEAVSSQMIDTLDNTLVIVDEERASLLDNISSNNQTVAFNDLLDESNYQKIIDQLKK